MKRILSIILTLSMLFSMTGMTAFAEDGTPPIGASGLLDCHPTHDTACGYTAEVVGEACTHTHDPACGFVAAKPETPCDTACTDTDGDGAVDHDPACAFAPAEDETPCTHTHDDSCGFVQAADGTPCTHECDICKPVAPAKTQRNFGAFALTPGTGGQANHGVDFTDVLKAGNHIYYGTYDHAKSLAEDGGTYGTVITTEGTATPILWRIMGEEANDGNLTVMSEYVLDSHVFNTSYNGGNAQNYADSELQVFLNGSFLSSFALTEQTLMTTGAAVTGMYDYLNGNAITGNHYPQKAYTDDGNFLTDNHTDNQVNTGSWPKTANTQTVYLPWGIYNTASVYWTAGNNTAEGKISDTYADNIGTLKNGTAVIWWLRSPDSVYSGYAHGVYPDGRVNHSGVNSFLGVRPAFKLNPSSVIFTSEIKSGADTAKGETEADSNYAAGATETNYKLTIVDAALTAGTVTAGGDSINGNLTKTITDAAEMIAIAATEATDSTKLTYKIVSNTTNKIVGYGQGTDNTAATVAATDLSGNPLANGNYSVYVWAQADELINSNRGSTPVYFTLTVARPTITATAGTGGSISPAGSVSVNPGDDQDFTISANSGYKIASVKVDGVDKGTISSYKFENVTTDRTIEATFSSTGGGGGGGYTPPTVDSTSTISQINSAPTGGTVIVPMSGATNAPASIFEAAKGKDVNVVFNYGSYTWTVNGKSIGTIPTGRIYYDLSVKNINSSVIAALAGNSGVLQLEITHSGSLPFTATLTYDVSTAHNGKTLYLYYYNPTTGKLEYRTSGTVSGGKIKLDFTHASQYLLTDKRIDKTDNPNTGVNNPFNDVKESDWFFNAVMIAYDQGLFSGTAADKFSPNMPMTRAMFATVLARLDGVDLSGYTASKFSDVAIGTWYGPAVAWAADKGITGGVGEGKFAPDKSITREEMAVMLYKYMKVKGITLPATGSSEPFSDSASFSPWAVDAIADMRRLGLISGAGGNRYNPQGTATRAEVAQIFLNYLNATVE